MKIETGLPYPFDAVMNLFSLMGNEGDEWTYCMKDEELIEILEGIVNDIHESYQNQNMASSSRKINQ